MAAVLGLGFFVAVLGIAIWSIVETARPRIHRILFLLEHGAVDAGPLPGPSRAMVRGRSVPLRVSLPAQLRAAA